METLLIPPSGFDGTWLIVEGEVNLDDLSDPRREGKVVRMKHADSIRYIPKSSEDYAHVAGMVSDAA